MAAPTRNSMNGSSATLPSRGSSVGPVGTMGYPVGGNFGASVSAATPARQRMGTEQWKVAEGVPPLIGDEGPFFEEEPDPEEERTDSKFDDFEEWYAHVAMPWNSSGSR